MVLYSSRSNSHKCADLRLIVQILMLSILFLSCEHEAQPNDSVQDLLSSLETQDWPKAQAFFTPEFPLNQFPLYLALKQGDSWRGLSQIEYIDHHIILHVDLKHLNQSHTYVFWLNHSKYSEYAKGDQGERPVIQGWLKAQDPQAQSVLLPTRFTSSSYRLLGQHQQQAQVASTALGILGADGSGALETGWQGRFELRKSRLLAKRLNAVKGKRKIKRKVCRNQRTWSKFLKVLDNNLNQNCMSELLFAAQRARYIDLSALKERIDRSHGRGGQTIRAQQDQERLERFLAIARSDHPSDFMPTVSKSMQDEIEEQPKENGVRFNGKLSLSQSLTFAAQDRMRPEITEAMIIAPPLTQCIQQITENWSRDFLSAESCDYQLSVYFTVKEQ